jgi:nicotinamide-nucleotide adenylyltransferase
MICLYIGRFQPFHKGHLFDVKNALSFSDHVIIGVGSSEESGTLPNPFSFSERKEMIERALQAEEVSSYEIVPIPDVNDDLTWVSHVQSLVPSFDVAYSGNEKVLSLFSKKGIPTKEVEMLPEVTATLVRERIVTGEDWKRMVPPPVYDYLVEIDGIKRLQEINSAE